MTPGLPRFAQAVARTLRTTARDILWRAAVLAAAGLIGLTGFGLVVFAMFGGLRLLVGPELSALLTGSALLVIASVLAWTAARAGRAPPATAAADLPPTAPSAVPPPPADAATMAIFTAAFVLGRRLADRWRG